MYPYDIIPGFDLYTIFFTLGLMSAVISFRILSDRLGLEAEIHNLSLFTGVIAIISGYFCAILTQAIYEYIETGVFSLKDAGMTFYGGFIGGALAFILIYFVFGFVVDKKKLRFRRFIFISDMAAASVAIAHALGRVGCLFAGCCHGAATDAWYGIYNCRLDAKAVPVPLFEALFLFALFAYLVLRVIKGKTYNLALYLIVYGIWRFFIEYLRVDDRGETVIKFLTPSQLTAVVLIVVGTAVFFVTKKLGTSRPEKKSESADAADSEVSEGSEDTAEPEDSAESEGSENSENGNEE